MFKRIKEWFKSKTIIQVETIAPTSTPTHQVDLRDIETRKRVKRAFEAQAKEMSARALRPHDPACKDPIICRKRKCFKWVSDKIVSDTYEVPPRT